MKKKTLSENLAKALGVAESGGKKEFDPELFLLRLQKVIIDHQKNLSDLIEQSKKNDRNDNLNQTIKELRSSIEALSKTADATAQGIRDQQIKVVEVEKVREVPPSKISVEVKQNPEDISANKSWMQKLVSTVLKEPIDTLIQMLMAEIRNSREETGAIAVRLVTKDGEDFYTAMYGGGGGGGGYIGSLDAGYVDKTTRRVVNGHDTGWLTYRANYSAAQTDVALITAGASEKIVIGSCMVTADKANTVDVAVRIGFGAANTPTGSGCFASHPGIAAGSGFPAQVPDGGIVSQTAGDDVRMTSEVSTGGSIDVVIIYKITT